MPTAEQILEALKTVRDPELGKDIVSLGMARDISVTDGAVSVRIVLTTPACPMRHAIQRDVETAIRAVPGVTAVSVTLDADVVAARTQEARLPGVRNVVVVGSGKGGVGKSTVAVNLAVALAGTGARVGLLDADLYGPSVPILLGLSDARPEAASIDGRDRLLPVHGHGVSVFSIGLLLKDTDAVIWRGPLLHKAIQQFIEDVAWGELDYLVVDLPPGTGDVHLSIAQLVPAAAAIVVTTPQDVAFADVLRAVRMFQVTKTPILGIVENMAGFVCPSCGAEHAVFGKGRIEKRALENGLAHLGAIPIDPAVSPLADQGIPVVVGAPDSIPARAFTGLAAAVAGRLSVIAFG